jgi:plastocyanin
MATIWRGELLITAIASALLSAPATAAPGRTATGEVQGQVTILRDGKPRAEHSNAVVYLEGVPGAPERAAAPSPAVIRQKDKQFTPSLTVVQSGATVDFPNEDRIFHNVFSVSRAARFDLGLYKSGSSRSVTVKRPGVVDVYCNIHADMEARIKVLDTPWYRVTGRDGRFRFTRVPVGIHPIVVWLPSGDEVRGTVTVRAGAVAQFRTSIAQVERPRRHLRKDGTPYGRYE